MQGHCLLDSHWYNYWHKNRTAHATVNANSAAHEDLLKACQHEAGTALIEVCVCS